MNTLELFNTKHELAIAAAEHAVLTLGTALNRHDSATWVLAGGTTPEVAYSIIADKYLDAIDWSRVIFVIGDERIAHFDSPDSNWYQIEEVLLRYMPPSAAALRPHSELPVRAAAKDYDRRLRTLPTNEAGMPRFDLVWLGMGEDGHTLSLFPGHASLRTTDSLVMPEAHSPKPPLERITLSLHGLTGTVDCAVLVTGEAKADSLAQAFNKTQPATQMPIVRATSTIQNSGGDVTWFIDSTAAAKLVV